MPGAGGFLRGEVAVRGDLVGKRMLLHASHVARGLGGHLGVLADRLFEVVSHRVSPAGRNDAGLLDTYAVAARVDRRGAAIPEDRYASRTGGRFRLARVKERAMEAVVKRNPTCESTFLLRR